MTLAVSLTGGHLPWDSGGPTGAAFGRRATGRAEVFHGEKGDVEGEANGRRRSPGEGIESLAGELGLLLSSALTLSK